MKTALAIRHVPYEGIAAFRQPIEAAGYAIDRIDVTDGRFAEVDFIAPDLVVMMGGPMGVYESDRHPWIAHELERLAARIALGRPTLGVCLGAQMMAAAMGARVFRGNAGFEIGYAPVTLHDRAHASPLAMLRDVPLLHWHGDSFDLPDDVELLASTPAYAHQAFRRGPNILALQFHAEMGLDPRFDAWLDYLDCPKMTGRLTAEHAAHGARAVAAGQAMIGDWLAGLSQ